MFPPAERRKVVVSRAGGLKTSTQFGSGLTWVLRSVACLYITVPGAVGDLADLLMRSDFDFKSLFKSLFIFICFYY